MVLLLLYFDLTFCGSTIRAPSSQWCSVSAEKTEAVLSFFKAVCQSAKSFLVYLFSTCFNMK